MILRLSRTKKMMKNWFMNKKRKKKTENYSKMNNKWKILSGENNWEGLIEPFHNDLRKYIINYGEMAQATYDNFINDRASKHAGSARYSKQKMFESVGLSKCNTFKYRVTKYIYATSRVEVPDAFIVRSMAGEWRRESNWIGFVAVAEEAVALGRRDVLVAWRGTVRTLEWVNDFEFELDEAKLIFGDGCDAKVHRGWYSIYTSQDPMSHLTCVSARYQVVGEIARLVNKYKNEEMSITITGHSMGAALGTLNAIDLIVNGYNNTVTGQSPCPVMAFLFACPRVGDANFKKAVEELKNLHILRVCNAMDVVPNYPMIGYVDVGVELGIDTTKSEYLKCPGDLSSWHSLEAYLHGVAGYQGVKWGFRIDKGVRDIALVNKHLDALKDEYCVPFYWWVEKNKGMVQQDDGSWVLMDHDDEDDDNDDLNVSC